MEFYVHSDWAKVNLALTGAASILLKFLFYSLDQSVSRIKYPLLLGDFYSSESIYLRKSLLPLQSAIIFVLIFSTEKKN